MNKDYEIRVKEEEILQHSEAIQKLRREIEVIQDGPILAKGDLRDYYSIVKVFGFQPMETLSSKCGGYGATGINSFETRELADKVARALEVIVAIRQCEGTLRHQPSNLATQMDAYYIHASDLPNYGQESHLYG